MASTGTKRVIEHYIEHGGAKMDEKSYQMYKIAILTQWLDRFFTPYAMLSGGYQQKCNLCKDYFERNDIDRQLAHMKKHKPSWFK